VSKRRLALLALLVAIGIYGYLQWQAIKVARDSARMESFKALVQYVAQYGVQGTIPAEALEQFNLPTNGDSDIPFRAVTLIDNGVAKTFCVRERGGTTDVLIGDVRGNQGRFYQADEYGKLLKSIRLGPTPQAAGDDRALFAAEVAYWLKWWAGRSNEK
jgi:hypothetical protein